MEDYLKERKCIVVKRDNRGRCVEANEDIQKIINLHKKRDISFLYNVT